MDSISIWSLTSGHVVIGNIPAQTYFELESPQLVSEVIFYAIQSIINQFYAFVQFGLLKQDYIEELVITFDGA
jgi:hypothetical protein